MSERTVNHRIRIAHPNTLTPEERERSISVDFPESPLGCVFNLRMDAAQGVPLPMNNRQTLENYRAWLNDMLDQQVPAVRNTLNALYRLLINGHELILTTRTSYRRYSPALEIQRRLTQILTDPIEPRGILRVTRNPHAYMQVRNDYDLFGVRERILGRPDRKARRKPDRQREQPYTPAFFRTGLTWTPQVELATDDHQRRQTISELDASHIRAFLDDHHALGAYLHDPEQDNPISFEFFEALGLHGANPEPSDAPHDLPPLDNTDVLTPDILAQPQPLDNNDDPDTGDDLSAIPEDLAGVLLLDEPAAPAPAITLQALLDDPDLPDLEDLDLPERQEVLRITAPAGDQPTLFDAASIEEVDNPLDDDEPTPTAPADNDESAYELADNPLDDDSDTDDEDDGPESIEAQPDAGETNEDDLDGAYEVVDNPLDDDQDDSEDDEDAEDADDQEPDHGEGEPLDLPAIDPASQPLPDVFFHNPFEA